MSCRSVCCLCKMPNTLVRMVFILVPVWLRTPVSTVFWPVCTHTTHTTNTTQTTNTHDGLCHVLAAGRHVDRESEQDGPQGHGAHRLPSDAPGRLPQSDRPPLHVLLLWCWRLLRRHQLRQLSHLGLADTWHRWLTLDREVLQHRHVNKHNEIHGTCGVFAINSVSDVCCFSYK